MCDARDMWKRSSSSSKNVQFSHIAVAYYETPTTNGADRGYKTL